MGRLPAPLGGLGGSGAEAFSRTLTALLDEPNTSKEQP